MQGSILFNGNIVFEVDFIRLFRERILTSHHDNAHVRSTRRVLLICAAWMDAEYKETHIKRVLNEIGIASNFVNGFDQNILNLCAYHEWQRFLSDHPRLQTLYKECLATIQQVKQFYQEKNTAFIELLHKHTAHLKDRYPGTTLGDVLGYNVTAAQPRLHNLDPKALLFHHSCQEIQGTLSALVDSDVRQAQICREVHEYFFRRSGIEQRVDYRERRALMLERILNAASIFIFGGHLESLYYSLRFWQLGDALKTALTLGTNFYTSSAGSMVLCDKIIVYDDFQADRGEGKQEFEFFDHGFGLVNKIKLFPHCMERVKTDDQDNLTYLAHRFGGAACVGLNQDSYLLLDTYIRDARFYERFMSLGTRDGVYVFDPSGQKIRKNYGETLALPGTWEDSALDAPALED